MNNINWKELREVAADVKEMLEDDSEKMYYGALSVGEDKFCETANSRGGLRKLFDLIVSGESQASINSYGRDNIEEIVSKCKDMGILVEKKFEGNYLYD